MANRREFLQMSIAATALPMTGAALFSSKLAAAHGPSSLSLYKVIFDERLDASRTFAHEAVRLGARVHGIRADITDLWYHDLHARWGHGPAAIAGLTEPGALFCLEQLAWDACQMRTVFRADHTRLKGHIEHTLAATSRALDQSTTLVGDADWTRWMAQLVTRHPGAQLPDGETTIVTPLAGPVDATPKHLVSWVIAPIARV